jgi:hypothetical protein
VGCLLAVACGDEAEDVTAPACNGVSPANIQYDEAVDGGACPDQPVTLLGTESEGDSCSEATDCAPTKCMCPGTTTCAWVAECSNGNCLDGNTACCLFGLQCAQ